MESSNLFAQNCRQVYLFNGCRMLRLFLHEFGFLMTDLLFFKKTLRPIAPPHHYHYTWHYVGRGDSRILGHGTGTTEHVYETSNCIFYIHGKIQSNLQKVHPSYYGLFVSDRAICESYPFQEYTPILYPICTTCGLILVNIKLKKL